MKRQEMTSEQIFSVCSSGFASYLLKNKKAFSLGTRKYHFLKYKKLFKSGFLSFFELGKLLPEIYEKYKASSISGNIRKFRYARVLNILFQKYKKVPLCQGSEYTFPEI